MVPFSVCSPLSLISLVLGFANHTGAMTSSPTVSPNSAAACVSANVITAPTPAASYTVPTIAVRDFVQSINTVPAAEVTTTAFVIPHPVQPDFEPRLPATNRDSADSDVAEQENQLMALINDARAENGLNPLTPDPILSSVARSHSQDMAVRGYFDHRAPAGEPVTPMDRYLAAVPDRPDYAMVGENIFYRSTTDSISNYAAQSHDAFMNSAGHRANILKPEYTNVGVGIYRNPVTGEYWVTEMFSTTTQP